MNIEELSARAMEIHHRFSELQASESRRPWTKEDVMQGFVGDVGDLMKLVMAKSGLRPASDVDRRLAHELSDCFWSVLVLAKLYGIDLEKEFTRTMNEIEAQIGAKTSASLSRPSTNP
jgi:NTP pyrophosphatase (non-canonical NTP hydrolase)